MKVTFEKPRNNKIFKFKTVLEIANFKDVLSFQVIT